MSNQYVMDRRQWVAEVISLLPDCYDDKPDVADDLAREFGIMSGLVSGGWYPNEALDQFLDREYNSDKITDSDLDQYNAKLKAYGDEKQAHYKNIEEEKAKI